MIELALLAVALPPSIAVTRYIWRVTPEQRTPKRDAELAALDMPPYIVELVEAESEEWARDEVRSEALRLHDMLDDWEHVQRELQRRYGASDTAATERAWQASGEQLTQLETDEWSMI